MKTAITLFTGGGLADIALMAAGFRVVAGLELVSEIAAVANMNLGGHVRVGDILEANPSDYPDADLHHYSPPCTRASVANANATESELDIAFARKIVEFVKVKRPRHFTLENVRGYRKFKAFQIIMDGLKECGYQSSVFVLNSANYGVPQTRIRLIVMASLDSKPLKPLPTHQKHQDKPASLFETRLPKWMGWYEAIEDLIPTLPESKFADWQLRRLPAELSTMLVGAGGFDGTVIQSKPNAPCFTITANQNQKDQLRAFIVDDQNGTINEDGSRELSIRHSPEPIFTIPASPSHKASYRAFIVPDGNASSFSVRSAEEPVRTIGDIERVGNAPKAFIVDRINGSTNTIRTGDEPIFTMTTYDAKHRAPNGFTDGKVVKMTPRCLARFQSMPDWYQLPDNDALSAKIIGNGFPCLMAQRIFEQF